MKRIKVEKTILGFQIYKRLPSGSIFTPDMWVPYKEVYSEDQLDREIEILKQYPKYY